MRLQRLLKCVYYTYDQYGQLVREDNASLDKTFIYEYNDNGNITSVKAYDYTSDDEPSGTPTTTTFGYNTTYPDRLTSFDDTTIAYNTMGCPTTYEGRNATWSKGKLSRIYCGSASQPGTLYHSSSYTYNGVCSKNFDYLQKSVTFCHPDHTYEMEEHNQEENTMDTKALGKRIQIAREERFMTQRELGKAIGCTPQHISAIERGVKTPTLETFVEIASALKMPADVLLQDVLPDWWETWEREIDRILMPLMPHMRTYLRRQIMDYHRLEEACSQMGQGVPQV